MGRRQEKLADQIRDIVASALARGEVSDPRIQGVSITHVEVTSDLFLASVFFRVFDQTGMEDVTSGLKSAAGRFRKLVASNIMLRRAPSLRFLHDESIETGARIEGLLKNLQDEPS